MTPSPRPARALARLTAALGAIGAFGLAAYTSATESMPELRIYDGYWMLLGATLAVALVSPWVWRWRRERSLPLVIVAAVIGCWVPLVALALRHGTPVVPRLRGAWFLMGADIVGVAVPVGVACLWLALREPTEPTVVP